MHPSDEQRVVEMVSAGARYKDVAEAIGRSPQWVSKTARANGVYSRFDKSLAPEQRFWMSVDVADCWTWTAGTEDGYGRFWDGERLWVAHRWLWVRLVGEVPDGRQLDHLCRNRACVNPDHLEPVTQAVNIRRGASVRHLCKNGHPRSGRNLMPSSKGSGVCRTCESARKRAAYARKKSGPVRPYRRKDHLAPGNF